MRVRVHSPAVASSLVAAIERAGGSARVVGDTLELVHPSGETAHERCELEFFVRAWVVGAERRDGLRRVPVEILG